MASGHRNRHGNQIPDLVTHSRGDEGGMDVGGDVEKRYDLPVVVLVSTELVSSVVVAVPEVVVDALSSAATSSTSTAWHSSEAAVSPVKTTRSSPCRQKPSTPGTEDVATCINVDLDWGFRLLVLNAESWRVGVLVKCHILSATLQVTSCIEIESCCVSFADDEYALPFIVKG